MLVFVCDVVRVVVSLLLFVFVMSIVMLFFGFVFVVIGVICLVGGLL